MGLSKAPRMFSRVDFTLTEGPTIDTNYPLFIIKLIFLSKTITPAGE